MPAEPQQRCASGMARDVEAGAPQQRLRRVDDLLARAAASRRHDRRRQAARGLEGELERAAEFGDVPGERRDARGLLRIGRIVAQHVAVVLDRRAAARGGDDDRVEPLAVDLAHPGVDVGARLGERALLRAHVMGERAAAAFALGEHDVDPGAVQQPDRRGVDLRRENGLRAAAEQRHAPARAGGAGGRIDAGALGRPRRGKRAGASASIASSCGPIPGRRASAGLRTRPSRREPSAARKRAARRQSRTSSRAQRRSSERAAIASLRSRRARDRQAGGSRRPKGRSSCRRGSDRQWSIG